MQSGKEPDAPPRRRRRVLLPALLLLLIGLALPYLFINDEPELLDHAARSAASGSFLSLSAGTTYYETAGPEGAQPVVFVHGTTIPSLVWDPNFRALAEAGRRTVRYDLYGRGLSDRPAVRYDLDLYVGQLEELLAQVAPGQPVDLVGLSMGGIVIAEFTRRHPDRVRKLVLIGPAGIGTELPLTAKLAQAPGAGEYLLRVAGTRLLAPSQRNLYRPERFPSFDSTYLRTIRFQGSRRAVLESLRNMPFNAYEEGYRALGVLGKPVLLVWGRHDNVVPFTNSERVRELVGAVNLAVVEEAGHLANYERPEVVNAALEDFLVP